MAKPFYFWQTVSKRPNGNPGLNRNIEKGRNPNLNFGSKKKFSRKRNQNLNFPINSGPNPCNRK